MMAVAESTGFPPIAAAGARVLILGTLPSRKSLECNQYYGHPRNQFWRIMGELFGAGPDLPYARRVRKLQQRHVALWDVLRTSVRPGSLDASIDASSARPNEFCDFLRRYPTITTIFFNGRKSEQLYQRLVTKAAGVRKNELSYVSLPSTSPAHAVMGFEEKLSHWTAVRDAAQMISTSDPRGK